MRQPLMHHSLLFVAASVLVTATLTMAANAEKAPAAQAMIFDYAKAADVPALSGGVFQKPKCCAITEWKVPRPTGGEVEMTVIAPPGKAKHPTVLWLHREGAEVKRAMFVQEAETLATMGIASLLVELPFKQPYVHRADNNAGDADVIRNAVIDARRALDWAATRPEFNIDRVAVVGFIAGANGSHVIGGQLGAFSPGLGNLGRANLVIGVRHQALTHELRQWHDCDVIRVYTTMVFAGANQLVLGRYFAGLTVGLQHQLSSRLRLAVVVHARRSASRNVALPLKAVAYFLASVGDLVQQFRVHFFPFNSNPSQRCKTNRSGR